ncbi:MAG: hypothetical protein K9L28_05610 [Synergistales bacterium]|nr:hypothetical protein [Synergistales bacterium]
MTLGMMALTVLLFAFGLYLGGCTKYRLIPLICGLALLFVSIFYADAHRESALALYGVGLGGGLSGATFFKKEHKKFQRLADRVNGVILSRTHRE